MRRTERVLSIAGAVAIGGLLSLAALAQVARESLSAIGSSPNSWEEAARNAVEEAGVRCVGPTVEVDKFDMRVERGRVVEFRARVRC